MKKILLLAFGMAISFLMNSQNPCQRATVNLQCGQVISNCANGTANNAMNGLTYWCVFDAYGSGSTGRDTVFRLQVDQTATYRFVLEMLNSKDMDIIIVKPGDFNNQCLFINSCTQANGGFSYEYNHVYGIYREVLDIRLDPNPTPYLVFVDSKEPGQALFNLTVDCTCTGIEANNDLPTGERIFCDDFQNYVTDKVIEPQSTRWERPDTTLPDGQVVSSGFVGQAVRFQGSTGNEPEDHFLLRNRYSTTSTAGQSEGRYRISWKMRMEYGQKGYYAVEHTAPVNVPGGVFNDAYHVTFLENGLGELRLGSIGSTPAATFPYPSGVWMNVVQIIDIDANVAELWINDNFVKSWTFSIGSTGNSIRLGSVKFKAPAGHDFKVDELCVWKASPCNPPASTAILVENGVTYASEAAARCALYTSLEWGDGYSLCQYGGTLIHRADQYFGELDNSDFAPSLLRTDPCVQAAYGNNVPFPLYADIYLFYKDDNQPVNVLFNDNGNASMRQFMFSCNYLDNGNCIRGQQCLTETGPNSGYFLPNTCDSFYYIVVTSGTVNDNYNLTVVPEGECGAGFNVLDIPCNGVNGELNGFITLQDEQVSSISQFNAIGAGNAYESCYNGNRDYTGGEEIYRFTLESPAIMTFKLTASSPMGMALYTFLCGKDCIAFSETKGSLNKTTLQAPLLEGTYHLIVDKSVADNLRNYDLEIECQKKSFFDIQALLSCDRPEDQAAPVVLGKVPSVCVTCLIPSPQPQDRHDVVINNLNKLSVGDAVHFLFRDSLNHYLTGSPVLSGFWDVPSGTAKTYSLPEDYVTPTLPGVDIDSLQCSFKEGDTLFIYMTESANGDHKFREIIPTFLPPNTGEATAGNEFEAGKKSIISFFELGNVVTWYTDKTSFETTDGAGRREIKFDANIPWTVEKVPNVPWLTLLDSSGPGDGLFSVLMDFEPNPSLLPRTTTLRFVSTEKPDVYRLYVVVTQRAPCTQPVINLQTLNSTLCDGDTLTLLADVGTDPVTGQSLAPLFDFTWKNSDGVEIFPLDFPAIPGQFNIVLNTGSYQYTVEASNKYCDGVDTEQIEVTITPPPPAPTPNSPTSSTICTDDPLPTFSVNAPPTGQVIQWFDAPNGGNLLAEGVHFTPTAYVSSTYYAGAVYAGGDCSSPSRVTFTLTVNPVPVVEIQEKVCTADHQFYQFNVVTNGSTAFLNGVPLTGNGGIFPVLNIDINQSVSIRVANQFCDTTLIVDAPICICEVETPGFIQNYAVCEGAPAPPISVSISQPNVSVNWYDAPNGVKLNATPVNPFLPQQPYLTNYYAQAINLLNGCESPGFRLVTLTVLPQPTLLLTDTTCTPNQDFYAITVATNGNDVTASAGIKSSSNNTYTFSQIPVNQSVTLTATAANGCTRTQTVDPPNCPCLTVQPPVSNGDVTICFGSPFPTLSVTVGAGQTANWYLSGNPVALGVTSYIPDQPGTYLVETFDPSLACTSAARTAVTFSILPEIPFTVSPPVCAYNRETYSFTITTTPGNSVELNGIQLSGNNGVFQTGNLPVTVNALFTVSDEMNQCQAFGNVVSPECPCIEIIEPPVNLTSNNLPVCQYQAKTLTVAVGPNETVNWYNAQNQLLQSASTVYGPNTQSPGDYTYFAEAYNPMTDCTGPERTAITFTVHPAPTVQVTKECTNQTQYTVTATVSNANTLTATAGVVTTGPGNNTFTISGIPLGTAVELIVTSTQTACTSNFNVSPPANCDCSLLGDVTPPIGGGNQQACVGQGSFPTLTASVVQPNVVIDWYDANGNLLLAGSASYSPPANLQTGLYLFYAEARNTLTQCVSNTRTGVQLTVSNLPLLLLSTICEPDFLTYKIQGQTEPGNNVSNSVGLYNNLGAGFFEITGIPKGVACSVTVANPATTCQRAESVLLSTCPCPVVNNPTSLGDQVMCQGDPSAPVLAVSVQNTSTETVNWYDNPLGGIPIGQGFTIQPTPPTSTRSYFAETILQNGFCPSPGRTEVKLEVRTRPTAFAGVNQTVCEGDTLPLNGIITGVSGGFWSASGGQFLPDNGALSADFFVTPFGQPSLTLTLVTDNPAGPCPAVSSSMELTLLDAPEILVDSVFCSNDFQSYNVIFSSSTSVLTTNMGPATQLPNQQYRVSNIPLNTNLQITGFNTGTACNTAVSIPAPNPCVCPTIAMPVSENGNVVVQCSNLGLPTLNVLVGQGLIANWYPSETSTVALLGNSLQFTPSLPGDYFVEAADPNNGCTSVRLKITVTIKQAPVIFIGPDAAFCAGSSLTLSADAGANYSYSWSTGQSSQQISVSTAGTYYVSVSLNDCIEIDSFVVTQHPLLTAGIAVTDSIDCFGYMDGAMTAVAQGGTLPIAAYFWSIQSGQPGISGLSAGTYSVTLADQAGCTAVASIALTQPPQLLLGNIEGLPATGGQSNGFIGIQPGGGTPPLSVQWFVQDSALSNQQQFLLDSIPNDTYSVIVTDANGCTVGSGPINLATVNSVEPGFDGQVTVFPNPSAGRVQVKLALPEEALVETQVMDVLGRSLFSQRSGLIKEGQIELDLSHYPSGLYWLKLKIGAQFMIKKIAINR